MGVVRHIEVELDNFDLTGWGESLEDFSCDTPESIIQDVLDYFHDCPEKLFDKIKIKKVWYEREEFENGVDKKRN